MLPADEVEPDSGDRQPAQRRERLADVVEVGVDDDLRRALGAREARVRPLQCLELVGGAILCQHRLVDLDPLCADRSQLPDHLCVYLDERIEQLEPIELAVHALAEQQERERPDQDRLGLYSLLPRFAVLLKRLRRGEAEAHAALELGDDVVIVRVEPLRHLHGGDVDALALQPAGHREVRLEVDLV